MQRSGLREILHVRRNLPGFRILARRNPGIVGELHFVQHHPTNAQATLARYSYPGYARYAPATLRSNQPRTKKL